MKVTGVMAVHKGMPTLPLAINSLKYFDKVVVHYTSDPEGKDTGVAYLEKLGWNNMTLTEVPKVTNFGKMFNKLLGDVETEYWYRVDADCVIHPAFYFYIKEMWKKHPESCLGCTGIVMAGKRRFYHEGSCDSMGDIDYNLRWSQMKGAPKGRLFTTSAVHEAIADNEPLPEEVVETGKETCLAGKDFVIPYVQVHWGDSYLPFNHEPLRERTELYRELGTPFILFDMLKAVRFEDFIDKLKARPTCHVDCLSACLIMPEKYIPEEI